jgi:hypothetical protein
MVFEDGNVLLNKEHNEYTSGIDGEEEKECGKALSRTLTRLSNEKIDNKDNEESVCAKYIKKLHYQVYKNGYRHSYSNIYIIVRKIHKQDTSAISNLLTNIELIYKHFDVIADKEPLSKGENKAITKKHIRKLYDHINLELQKLNDYESFEKAEERAKKIDEKINKLDSNIEKTSLELKNQTISFVTILGIFAAIIITFISGLIFSSTVFSNLDKVNIWKLSFLIVLFGSIILALGYFLFDFINKIIFDDNKKELQDNKFIFIIKTLLIILVILFICVIVTENINVIKKFIYFFCEDYSFFMLY